MASSRIKLLAIITSIFATTNVHASVPPSQEDVQSAQLLSILIEKGQVVQDEKSGDLRINASVAQLLEENGLLKKVDVKDAKLASGSNSTTGGF